MIANTHYNMIDTLFCFIGASKWDEIVIAFFKTLSCEDHAPHHRNVSNWIRNNRNVGISTHMEQHCHFSRMFNEKYVNWGALELSIGTPLDNSVRYTLSELFLWAMTEGRVSEDLGYGFRLKH